MSLRVSDLQDEVDGRVNNCGLRLLDSLMSGRREDCGAQGFGPIRDTPFLRSRRHRMVGH